MGLKEFDFIDESIDMLKAMSPTLELIADDIEEYFEDILEGKDQEYINITSRVKGEASLREKIIRNRYLKKYNEAGNLIHNLSDLIGIRIECRFIEDEKKIYRLLKRYFNKTDDKIYYYNKDNKSIKLKLSERQPNKQKNGFEIYRIDGMFNYLDRQIKFELQVKSLVNIFWSEIEHKIIYKNNTYLLADGFLKDMMSSIKNNLTMIDNQLLSIYKNFNTGAINNMENSKKEIEKVLAKLAHDAFSSKMKDSIGFVVDFKKPCETILSYSFNKKEKDQDIFGDFMLEEFAKLNSIAKKNIDFTENINFEAEPVFKDEFCCNLGEYIKSKLNTEFPWNLFFRILFEIEPYNNKKDFENFIMFIKEQVMSDESKCQIIKYFDNGSDIIEDLYKGISDAIIEADSVETMYDYNLENINFIGSEVVTYICREFDSYEEYVNNKEDVNEKLRNKIIQIFE
ncbi:GTP pyrophosphokinase [Romboutsia weinsteinii]|uniref:GTP pyrophosphokinase n=1 Tax=Romboutsia weinsteinii TaxID=2020949 RepID=A0A371J8F1_9FIRM|nr:GTP pyrophosphokinase [Romboutsia weinsteinii]RDY29042.1 GTP pyrophosphokinase [Romboutsia weinsteinii]